jgi:hypothetical protein
MNLNEAQQRDYGKLGSNEARINITKIFNMYP